MDILDILKDKEGVVKFPLKTIETNDKVPKGLRSLTNNDNTDFKVNKLLEVVANQAVQIKSLAIINLIYAQSNSFDTNISKMMVKMGRGEEALKQMFKNKMDGK